MGKMVKVEFIEKNGSDYAVVLNNGYVVLKNKLQFFVKKTKRSKYERCFASQLKDGPVGEHDNIYGYMRKEHIFHKAVSVHKSQISKNTLICLGLLEKKVTHTIGEVAKAFCKEHDDVIRKLRRHGIINITSDKSAIVGALNFAVKCDIFAITKNGWIQKYRNGNSRYPTTLNPRVKKDPKDYEGTINGHLYCRGSRCIVLIDDNGPKWMEMADILIKHVERIRKRESV